MLQLKRQEIATQERLCSGALIMYSASATSHAISVVLSQSLPYAKRSTA